MTTKIPVLIPVKEYSERCNKKNYALLPYTAKWLHAQDLADSAWVITDSTGLMELAESLNKLTLNFNNHFNFNGGV